MFVPLFGRLLVFVQVFLGELLLVSVMFLLDNLVALGHVLHDHGVLELHVHDVHGLRDDLVVHYHVEVVVLDELHYPPKGGSALIDVNVTMRNARSRMNLKMKCDDCS